MAHRNRQLLRSHSGIPKTKYTYDDDDDDDDDNSRGGSSRSSYPKDMVDEKDIDRAKKLLSLVCSNVTTDNFTQDTFSSRNAWEKLLPVITWSFNYKQSVEAVLEYTAACFNVVGSSPDLARSGSSTPCRKCQLSDRSTKMDKRKTDYGRYNSINTDPQYVQDLEKEIERLKENIVRQDKEIEMRKREIDDLSHRLSSEMNTKLSGDERNIENINVRIRPSTVVSKYQTICTQEWLNAKESMDKHLRSASEVDKLRALSEVFKVSYEVTEQLLDAFSSKMNEILMNPSKYTGTVSSKHGGGLGAFGGGKKKGGKHVLSGSSQTALCNLLRSVSDDVDTQQLVQTTLEELTAHNEKPLRKIYTSIIHDDKFVSFVEEAVRLTWMMGVQRPKMVFEYKYGIEKKVDDQLQEIQWGSPGDPRRGAVVKFYVYPILYHGDKPNSKGKVYIA